MPKMVTLTDDDLFGDVGHILGGTIEPGKVFDQTVDLDGVPMAIEPCQSARR